MGKFSILVVVITAANVLSFAPLQAQDHYKLSSASTVQISGTSTLSDWVVRSQQVSGEMTFKVSGKKTGENKTATGTIEKANALLEVTSIKSEKGETMDNKLYKALKSDMHPQITFRLANPVHLSKAPAILAATGNVELAGVSRPMTFDLNVTYSGDAFRVTGSRPLKLSDFAIDPPTAMFGQIETGDEIVVELDLYFSK